MDKFVITGGKPLQGTIPAAGAKNAALPLLAATLLANSPVTLTNVPDLQDVTTLINVIKALGVTVTRDNNTVTVDNSTISNHFAPYDLVRTMRASILVLGPLLARYGDAKVSLPGGCAIGSRPVDQHLKNLEQLGANISVESGYVNAQVDGRLKGTKLLFDMVTVGGTEHLVMAATLAKGTTVIENAAREPEVVDLCHFLMAMGAQIEGIGTSVITVHGVAELKGCTYRVVSDRIEAGSYLAAAVMSSGCVKVTHTEPELMDSLLIKFGEMGAEVTTGDDWVQVDMQGKRPKAVNIRTAPHPGFPTDMQAQIMAINVVAEGTGTVTETIFENRFMHVPELARMGANIHIDGHSAVVTGVERLQGAEVMATDLRASFSLVIAGCCATGTTTVSRIYHIDRGYEHVVEKLQSLGANIVRVKA